MRHQAHRTLPLAHPRERHAVDRPEGDRIHAKLMEMVLGILVFFFLMAVTSTKRWPTAAFAHCCCRGALRSSGTNCLLNLEVMRTGLRYLLVQLTLNFLGQIIPAAMLPGNPLGNMARAFAPLPCMKRLTVLQVFKTYSVLTIDVFVLFVQDLKLGDYLKILPRESFLVQSISTVLYVACLIAVKEWLLDAIPIICQYTRWRRKGTCHVPGGVPREHHSRDSLTQFELYEKISLASSHKPSKM